MKTELMEARLKEAFPDSDVAVIDLRGSGDAFEIRISSPSLMALKLRERHQTIMALFSHELDAGAIHALSIKIV